MLPDQVSLVVYARVIHGTQDQVCHARMCLVIKTDRQPLMFILVYIRC